MTAKQKAKERNIKHGIRERPAPRVRETKCDFTKCPCPLPLGNMTCADASRALKAAKSLGHKCEEYTCSRGRMRTGECFTPDQKRQLSARRRRTTESLQEHQKEGTEELIQVATSAGKAVGESSSAKAGCDPKTHFMAKIKYNWN